MILNALDCNKLIPESYKERVKGVPIPAEDSVAGDIWSGLNGQTARLTISNDRGDNILRIYDACHKQQQAVAKLLEPKRPWWKPF